MTNLKRCPCCNGAAIPDAMIGEQEMPGCSVCSLVADTAEDWNRRSTSADEMTMRDYFAAQALSGLLASKTFFGAVPAARSAYEYADAMIAARDGDGS